MWTFHTLDDRVRSKEGRKKRGMDRWKGTGPRPSRRSRSDSDRRSRGRGRRPSVSIENRVCGWTEEVGPLGVEGR